MKKILHILRSQAWGGLELYTLDFISKMQSAELDQFLLCSRHSKVAEQARQRGLKITHNPWMILGKWDILHVHERGDLLIARWALCFKFKTRFIYTLMMNAPPKKRLHHYWIYRRVDAIISSSKWVAEEIKKNFPVKPQVIHWVPYGRSYEYSPISFEQKIAMRAKLALPLDKFIFISVCRVDKGKGIIELAKSLSELPSEIRQQLQVIIIGDPTLEKINSDGQPIYEKQAEEALVELQIAIKKYPEELRHISYQYNIHEWLQAADFFVLASWLETYALAVLDAMSVGLPIIGAKSGGTIEQIGAEEQRGLFFKPKEAKSLAATMSFTVTHFAQVVPLGQAAFEWVTQTHHWSKTIEQFNQIYQIPED